MKLIDADKLKQKLIMNFSKKPEAQYIYQHLIDIVDDAPTIPVYEHEKLKCKWLETETYNYKCSFCGGIALELEDYPYKSDFCPHCGADMRSVVHD